MLSSLKKQFDNDKEFLLNHTKEFLTTPGVGVTLETNRAKIEGKNGETPILIRDGRNNPNEKIVLGTKAFEMQYLNAIRGAINIAKGKINLSLC